ncbi:MAG: hypothetical protein HETSPECPRED_001437 [Heterodermia speciosa]|uniref:Uncharacterized protein n=1 Tax=Heterodermia speciosa TaxID=116794 RepID=A0A8H3PF22_9LECA|nr:MAG: hypothetical protein HETSPECPRED_001437 [Heterodermia speciosa]
MAESPTFGPTACDHCTHRTIYASDFNSRAIYAPDFDSEDIYAYGFNSKTFYASEFEPGSTYNYHTPIFVQPRRCRRCPECDRLPQPPPVPNGLPLNLGHPGMGPPPPGPGPQGVPKAQETPTSRRGKNTEEFAGKYEHQERNIAQESKWNGMGEYMAFFKYLFPLKNMVSLWESVLATWMGSRDG